MYNKYRCAEYSVTVTHTLIVTQNEPLRMECTCAQNTIGYLTII